MERTSVLHVTYHRLKLRHVRGLVAIAEHGKLVKAAEALAITQPAVSKLLAELEDIVGQRLVERTRKGVTLNSAGRILLRYAGSSLRTLREGLDSIARSRDVDAPVIVIGALPTVAATVLPVALRRFESDVPQARLRVLTGTNAQLLALLRQAEIDVVIGRLADPADMRALAFEHLYTEPLVFAVRPGHPLARRARVTVSDVVAYRFALPDAGTPIRQHADQFFIASGYGVPDAYLETIDLAFGRSYVLQSDAIWFAPLGAVEHDVQHCVLYRLPLDTTSTLGPVGLSVRADWVPSDAVQRLLAEIRAAAASRADTYAFEQSQASPSPTARSVER